jgi:protein-L-isoaspartate(D-aspartate) O-methyltransferase
VVIKSDSDGLPLSASTQPAMMAIMLDLLGLVAGHRVLEIGTGTGYNAALIAHIVGGQEYVVTVDIDAALIAQARANLAEVGCGGIAVVCADGATGLPDSAPYDRVIVTAGVWDLAPQWFAQLGSGGRIVLPLAVRGIQLAVAIERRGDRLTGGPACRCSFIRMTGTSSGPESYVALGPQPGLHAQVADGPVPDAGELYEALREPGTEVPAGLQAGSIAELADLDLWLTVTEPQLTRLNLMGRHEGRATGTQRRIASQLPLGGLADVGQRHGLGVAAVTATGGLVQQAPFGIAVLGYGHGGAILAKYLASRAAVWDEGGRPGVAGLELSVHPPGTPTEATEGQIIIDRPHARLSVRWPAS